MPHLDRDGVKIYYTDSGGPGPAILFTHGYSASSTMWADQQPLVASGFRVLCWDVRGHQFSDSPDSDELFAKELSIDDMVAILDECGLEKAAICGHSMGGFLSFEFLLAHPERTSSIILFGSGPGFRNAKGRDGWNKMSIKMGEKFLEKGKGAIHPKAAEVVSAQHRDEPSGWMGLYRAAKFILTQQVRLFF